MQLDCSVLSLPAPGRVTCFLLVDTLKPALFLHLEVSSYDQSVMWGVLEVFACALNPVADTFILLLQCCILVLGLICRSMYIRRSNTVRCLLLLVA